MQFDTAACFRYKSHLMKPIKYIAYFDTHDSSIKRNYVASASNKLEYIAKAIASNGRDVEIVSVSEVVEDKFALYKGERKPIAMGVALKLPFSWGGNSSVLRRLKIFWHLLYLFLYIVFRTTKGEPVIVYHSLGYFDIIRWARKIRGFRLILEVEEIYSDVSKMSPYWRNLEFRMFGAADSFILSTELLNERINPSNKPAVVIYGTYQVEPVIADKFDDGLIHVVYAGTFDHNKGGAQNAIAAVPFLPANYHMHICGFGTEEDTKMVETLIREASAASKAKVTYDGMKKGREFVEFLQRCHIGLSTQSPGDAYNDTSFPSKVLTYMANGLSVVSIRIPVLEASGLDGMISFYEQPDGRKIANALSEAELCDNRSSVSALDRDFRAKINAVL